MHVGFIGLGAMGHSMAGHLSGRGLLMVVGNRTQAKADAFAAERGLRVATSAMDFADCDVVMLCVPADSDVLENVDALAAVLAPGSVVVDHSTVSVATAKAAAARLRERDIGF